MVEEVSLEAEAAAEVAEAGRTHSLLHYRCNFKYYMVE